MTQLFPAPWTLHGQGHIFLYRFSRAFINQEGLMPASLRPAFVGGVGALMLVTYSHSDCGPYRELLLIPGNFLIQGKVRRSITHIVVSTEVSVVNGRRNWGIPKQEGSFVVDRDADGREAWSVHSDGRAIFQGRVSSVGWVPWLPLHSALLPHTLAHAYQDELFVTKVSARAWGKPCRLTVDHEPGTNGLDFSTERPLIGMSIDPFSMTFHVPTVHPLESGRVLEPA